VLLTQNWLSQMLAGFTLSRGITEPRLLNHYTREKREFLLPLFAVMSFLIPQVVFVAAYKSLVNRW